MSRFYKYINEGFKEDAINIERLIKNDCKPYISGLKRNKIKSYFTRNMKALKDPFGSKFVRKDRESRGTDPESFTIINNGLEKNGYVRRDECVIATSKDRKIFGERYGIFPIGKFKYTYMSSSDFNSVSNWELGSAREYSVVEDFLTGGVLNEEEIKLFFDVLEKNLHIKNPKLCFENKLEIGFGCEKYYYVDRNLMMSLIDNKVLKFKLL